MLLVSVSITCNAWHKLRLYIHWSEENFFTLIYHGIVLPVLLIAIVFAFKLFNKRNELFLVSKLQPTVYNHNAIKFITDTNFMHEWFKHVYLCARTQDCTSVLTAKKRPIFIFCFTWVILNRCKFIALHITRAQWDQELLIEDFSKNL